VGVKPAHRPDRAKEDNKVRDRSVHCRQFFCVKGLMKGPVIRLDQTPGERQKNTTSPGKTKKVPTPHRATDGSNKVKRSCAVFFPRGTSGQKLLVGSCEGQRKQKISIAEKEKKKREKGFVLEHKWLKVQGGDDTPPNHTSRKGGK